VVITAFLRHDLCTVVDTVLVITKKIILIAWVEKLFSKWFSHRQSQVQAVWPVNYVSFLFSLFLIHWLWGCWKITPSSLTEIAAGSSTGSCNLTIYIQLHQGPHIDIGRLGLPVKQWKTLLLETLAYYKKNETTTNMVAKEKLSPQRRLNIVAVATKGAMF